MKRLALLSMLVLAGCSINQEDEQPSAHELEWMYKELVAFCLGVPTYKTDAAPFEQRVACIEAVMP